MALMGVSRRDGRLASRPLLWFFRTDAASASLTSLIGNERAPLCDSRRLNVQAVASRVLYRQSARHQVPQLPSCGQTGHGARCVNHARYRSSIVYRLYIIQSPVRQTYSPHMRVPRPHLAPPIPGIQFPFSRLLRPDRVVTGVPPLSVTLLQRRWALPFSLPARPRRGDARHA